MTDIFRIGLRFVFRAKRVQLGVNIVLYYKHSTMTRYLPRRNATNTSVQLHIIVSHQAATYCQLTHYEMCSQVLPFVVQPVWRKLPDTKSLNLRMFVWISSVY